MRTRQDAGEPVHVAPRLARLTGRLLVPRQREARPRVRDHIPAIWAPLATATRGPMAVGLALLGRAGA
jgi:hypothetical protein